MYTQRELRDCFGQFPTGVTIVTVRHDGLVHGATMSSFAPVSLDPALVVISASRRSRICELLPGAWFGVNVLGAHQRDLAGHFAGQRTAAPAIVSWAASSDPPRLAGCVAHLACAPWASYDGGDHVLFVGEVRHCAIDDGEPLVVHRGAFLEMEQGPKPSPWAESLDGPGEWLSRTSPGQ